jgi:hypothetical protein
MYERVLISKIPKNWYFIMQIKIDRLVQNIQHSKKLSIMKKPALFFIVSIVLSFTSYAQISFIPKAGITISNTKFKDELK